MPASEKITVNIDIHEIRIVHFESTTRVPELTRQPATASYEFIFDQKFNLHEADKLFDLALLVTLYEKQAGGTKIELANMQLEMSFLISNYGEVVKMDKDQASVPDQLLTLTSGIILSTARGVFAFHVKDSIINNAIIPIVNPKLFLTTKDR